MELQLQPNGNFNHIKTTKTTLTATKRAADFGNFATPAQSNITIISTNTNMNSNANGSLIMIQLNGRKVLSPPSDWEGPPPSSACELYVRHIPKNLDEQKLILPFLRFGRIYEMRVPMDFNQANRGYAYVKYTNEEDAACAMEVLSHFYILPGKKLEIMHSYEKSRLFVSNIPRNLSERVIEEKLRELFPTMQRVYTRAGGSSFQRDAEMKISEGGVENDAGGGDGSPLTAEQQKICNRGHVFIQFPSHMHALEAKKKTTPGLVRLWDRDLKVVWANSDCTVDMSKETKTLFVRNVDMSVNNSNIIEMLVNYVPRTAIRKISKVRSTAFFEFVTREAAENCLLQLQGQMLCGQRLDVEWAKPSEQQSLHRMRNTDFDAVLRLKCIANGWQVPVIIFSTYIDAERLQYCSVMLRSGNGSVRGVFCILQIHDLVDIHSRLCEVVCVLIDTIGAFPDYNYVFYVHKDNAHLMGMVTHNLQTVDFIASHGVPKDYYIDLNEIVDMSWAIAILSTASESALLAAYQESFCTNTTYTYLKNWAFLGRRVFGTIMPKYRNKPPLSHNLNNTQVVLALCSILTGTNCPNYPYLPFAVSTFDTGYEELRYVTLTLMPLSLAQSRFAVNHVLNHVKFGDAQYYHPAQRINIPPLWISACSYSLSIKQPHLQHNQQQRQQYQQQQHRQQHHHNQKYQLQQQQTL